MNTEKFQRKLSAILSADVKGYSRLMRADEDETVRTLTAQRRAIAKLVVQYRGSMVDSPGQLHESRFARRLLGLQASYIRKRFTAWFHPGLLQIEHPANCHHL